MNEHELTYFHLEEEGVNLKLKKGADPIVMSAAPAVATPSPATSAAPCPTDTANETPEPTGTTVTAPMVGTFYAASSPDAEPYVKVGDTVSVGQTLCIIEAMKVMNEIESTVAGTVVAIVQKDGESVQYGDILFRIQ